MIVNLVMYCSLVSYYDLHRSRTEPMAMDYGLKNLLVLFERSPVKN